MSYLGDACDAARAYCDRKRPVKDGREENRFGTWSFKPMRTHVMKISAPCPVVKQKHDAGNTALTPITKFGEMMTGFYSTHDFPSNV